MYQVNPDRRRRFDLVGSESKVVALPLNQEALDRVSDRQTLATLGTSASSVSVSAKKECANVPGIALVEQPVSAVGILPNEGTLDNEKNVSTLSSDRHLEQFIGNLLKYGVLLSSSIVLLGGVLYLIEYGTQTADYQFFRGESSVFSSPKGLITAIASGHCRGIIQLGLLILIATPIARVAFSLLAFLWQRDFTYIILTLFVLSGLIYSFIGAYV